MGAGVDKRAELREKALKDLQQSGVLMLDGHFDYGNGYHGRVYLNPHQLFRTPSTIWRFAQDLIDLMPGDLVQQTQVVAGPVTGGALRRTGARGGGNRRGDGRNLRSMRGGRWPQRPEHRARRIRRARELQVGRVSAVQGRRPDHTVLRCGDGTTKTRRYEDPRRSSL